MTHSQHFISNSMVCTCLDSSRKTHNLNTTSTYKHTQTQLTKEEENEAGKR